LRQRLKQRLRTAAKLLRAASPRAIPAVRGRCKRQGLRLIQSPPLLRAETMAAAVRVHACRSRDECCACLQPTAGRTSRGYGGDGPRRFKRS
jgi:hypothetical protein